VVKEFFKGSIWLITTSFFVKLLSFITISVLAYFLSLEEVGIYTLIYSFVISLQGFSGLGVGLALQRFVSKNENNPNAISSAFTSGFFVQVVSLTIVFIVLILFSDFFLRAYFNNLIDFKFYALAIIYLIFQAASEFIINLLVGLKEFRLHSLRLLLLSFLLFLFSFFGSYLFGLQGALVGLVVASMINLLISISVLIRMSQKFNLRVFTWQLPNFLLIRNLFRDGFPYYLGNTMVGSVSSLIVFGLLAKSVRLEDLAYFRIGQSLGSIISFAPAVVSPVSISFLSGISSEFDKNRLKKIQIDLVVFFVLIGIAIINIFTKEIVLILFGSKYLAGADQFSFYSIYLFLNVLAGIFGNFIISRDLSYKFSYISTVGVGILLLITFYLTPEIGIDGYIWGLIIGQFFGLVWLMTIEVSHNQLMLKVLLRLSLIVFLFLFVVTSIKYFDFDLLHRVLSFLLLITLSIYCFVKIIADEEFIKKIKSFFVKKIFIH